MHCKQIWTTAESSVRHSNDDILPIFSVMYSPVEPHTWPINLCVVIKCSWKWKACSYLLICISSRDLFFFVNDKDRASARLTPIPSPWIPDRQWLSWSWILIILVGREKRGFFNLQLKTFSPLPNKHPPHCQGHSQRCLTTSPGPQSFIWVLQTKHVAE